MPKLKVLSGKDVIRIFEHFGFVIAHQRGSHVKLRRELKDLRQTLTISLRVSTGAFRIAS